MAERKKTTRTKTSQKKDTNTKANTNSQTPSEPDPEVLAKLAQVKAKLHETFGQVVLAMMASPRYRHQSLSDLNSNLLEPLIRDRVAIASVAPKEKSPITNLAGVAVWASVSEEVDTKIREQVSAGIFPVRLKSDEWTSGEINWLLDIIAPNQKLATNVLANFQQVVKDKELRIHPLVTKLIDPAAIKKSGNKSSGEKTDA